MTDFQQFMERQKAWSLRNFGDSLRTNGITRHIEKELDEIRAEPLDRTEWLDVLTLALDGYWRCGGTDIMADLQALQDRNFARKWVPSSDPENEPSEHDRSPQ